MQCEIGRMEINYTFYFFTFFEKVIKKLLTFCYWGNDSVFKMVIFYESTIKIEVVLAAVKLYT